MVNKRFRWLDGLWLGYNLVKCRGMQSCSRCARLNRFAGLWWLRGCWGIHAVGCQSRKEGCLERHQRFCPGDFATGPASVICLKSPSLDALVDPLNVQNNLALLTGILAVETLTALTMGVNYDRSKSLFER